MKVLSINEAEEVSGGNYGQAVGTAGLILGGAQLGAYLAGARAGATLGAAAGPVGAVVGGVIGASAAYFYYQYA
ncbi:hypothetical protein [Roseateles sp. LYH14W]|uniref:Bacteriocin n=1 Tax=Pelomonas parva TaxID=3299032 RepID=A0ABW7EWV9_9BURK